MNDKSVVQHDDGVSEGIQIYIGDIEIYALRQVGTPGKYLITILEDGIGEGVEIGWVDNLVDVFPLVTAIKQIQNQWS